MLDKLNLIIDHLVFIKAEAMLVASAVLLLVIGLIFSSKILLKILYASSLLLFLYLSELGEGTVFLFQDYYRSGGFEVAFKMLFAGFGACLIFYPSEKKQGVEFYFLLLSIVIGSSFLISANHLLLFYITIELISFSSYMVVNLGNGARVYEAGIKYLIFGGTASGIMLYGISILYGYQGTLILTDFSFSISEPFYLFGMIAALAGLFFKVSIFPFHIWVPSTYQEGPNAAVSMIATVPKIAGLIVLMRWFEALRVFDFVWARPIFITLAILTISIGVLGAIKQQNAKRMIAYGAIAHSGFLFSLLLIPLSIGIEPFIWYAIIYALSNLCVFMLISVFENKSIIELSDYAGLGAKNAYFGALFVIVLVALIGLPPTLGFNAKLYLFTGLLSYYEVSNSLIVLTLLIVAVFSTIISLFFYLKIPYNYFLKSSNEVSLNTNITEKVVATIFCFLLLFGFLYPDLLINIIDNIKLN